MSRTPQQVIDAAPMSRIQIVAVTLCVLLNALDGFDVLSISFAAPGIAQEWGIDRGALGVVLSMELIGMAFGSLLLGPVADRYGRRPVILGCLLAMSLGMFAAAKAMGIVDLSVYRFITGLGIGGMLAATNAMTAETANGRYRNMSVIAMAAGYPVGVVLGGMLVSSLLVEFDWRVVFYFGGVVTVLFLPLVWFLLPESVAFLAQARSQDALERANAALTRMGHPAADALGEELQKPSVAELFQPVLRSRTVLLTVAYFAHIMTFYFLLKWIPKIVVDMGYNPSEAGGILVWANVGGLAGSLTLGLITRWFNLRYSLIVLLLGSAIAITLFGRGQANLAELAVYAGAAGFFTNGVIVGLYALFAQVFPTNVRAGGTGFVIGLGRGGAALGPIVAGLMFAFSYGLDTVAMSMALGSLIALVALLFLRTDADAL